MRPHVETVQNTDLMWHPAELPGGEGKAVQRNLSYDEENGAASTEVYFPSGWSRPSGFHYADTEWFVLDGEVKVGNRVLGRHGYLRAPAGQLTPDIEVKPESTLLIFREYGDFAFDQSEESWDRQVITSQNAYEEKPGDLTVLDTRTEATWIPNIYEGDSQRFLHIKFLYHVPSPEGNHTKGWATLMGFAPPKWREHRVAHHPCFEEAYCVWGEMDYNFGHIVPGNYFFRPAKVKHGNFDSYPQSGAAWIFRLDGDLINWITSGSRVEVHGKARNYDPENPAQRPEIAGLPVRSKTTGVWDGDGR